MKLFFLLYSDYCRLNKKRPVFTKIIYLVGVDGDAEKTRIGVNKELDVAFGQVVDDRGLGEVGHVGQILEQFVLGRVLLLNELFLDLLFFHVSLAQNFLRSRLGSVTEKLKGNFEILLLFSYFPFLKTLTLTRTLSI